MKITFWGVRGLVPAPGPETVKVGGNTPCLEVRTDAGELCILDAGTGIIPLGRQLMAGPMGQGRGQACIFLTHMHWDHIQGFPFFAPVFVPGNRLVVHGPASSSEMLEGMLEGQMNPHFSPLQTMKNLGATIDLVATGRGNSGTCAVGLQVRAITVPHGDAEALAYRFEEEGRVLVYAPDVGGMTGGPTPDAIALCRDADVLVHDATLAVDGDDPALGSVYSTLEGAIELAVRAGVRRLVLFHYHPDHDDARVGALLERGRQLVRERLPEGSLLVELAIEGGSVDV